MELLYYRKKTKWDLFSEYSWLEDTIKLRLSRGETFKKMY